MSGETHRDNQRRESNMMKTDKSLVQDTEGLSFVEYLIVLCVVALLGFAAWQAFGTQVSGQIDASTGDVTGMVDMNATVQ